MICNSCGGIIGRDCFNPEECAYISERIEAKRVHEQERYINSQQQKIDDLTAKLLKLEKTNKNEPILPT